VHKCRDLTLSCAPRMCGCVCQCGGLMVLRWAPGGFLVSLPSVLLLRCCFFVVAPSSLVLLHCCFFRCRVFVVASSLLLFGDRRWLQ